MKISRIIGGMLLACLAFAIVAGEALGEDLEGMIDPYEIVNVSSQVPGILVMVAERGDIVKKGQVVAQLRAGVENANVNLARVQVEFSKRKLERNREMFLKKHISENEKDEFETEIAKGEALLQDAVEKLEMRTIRSTIDGVVMKRELSVGEYVGEMPILVIAQIHPLNVEVVVPVRQLGSVRQGMSAEVRAESPVGGVYVGKVVIVDKVVDAASGTFGVRVELPNPSLNLPAGLRCRVRFLKK
ncbi:MAG: efflux RND transporter periplasmic adaptor subunit [Proteobacteria bacterium]|nr:efflux RND transporter periplasmic adaptor subunit [Pseudomonadota bacterium]